MRGTVVVYSIQSCPHCRAAKWTLQQRDVPYTDVDVEQFPGVRDWLHGVTGLTSVPQVFFNQRHIGGNAQLQALMEDSDEWDRALKLLETEEMGSGDAAPLIPDPDEAVEAPLEVSLSVDCESDAVSRLAAELRDHPGLITDHRTGLFRSARRTFTGAAFLDWVLSEKKTDSEAGAVAAGQELLDKHYIVPVGSAKKTGCGSFKVSPDALYRMLEDNCSLVLNCGPVSGCSPPAATELASSLRRLILKLYSDSISPDGRTVDYAAIGSSEGWSHYVQLAGELRRVDLATLSHQQRLAFFINIYNALIIHGNIAFGHPKNVLQRWKFFNNTSYMLAGQRYTLQDIENGILRANRRGVGALRPQFTDPDDPRLGLALAAPEPRIHFALNCGARSCPPIKTFSDTDIESELDLASASYLDSEEGVRVDANSSTIYLSTLLKWYRPDFGDSDSQVVEWVVKHLTSGGKSDQISNLLSTGRFKLKYIPYDWSHNAK